MATDKTKAVKWLKVFGWVSGTAFIFFIGLLLLPDWLQGKLESITYQKSKGLYKLELHGLKVSPFIGNLAADSLSLTPNYNRWKQLHQTKNSPPRVLFEVKTQALSFTGINLIGLIFGKPLQADALEIVEPGILLSTMHADTAERYKAAHETATGIIKNMQLGKIVISGGNLRFRNHNQKAPYLFNIANLNIEARDFKLDSQSYAAENRVFYTTLIALRAREATYLVPDGHYRATIDSLSLNTQDQTVYAQNFYLKPLKSATRMSVAKGKAVTTNDLKVKSIVLNGVDYRSYFQKKEFKARYAEVESPALRAYKNRRTGQPEKPKPTLHEIAQQIRAPFLLDTLKVRNGYIRYSEFAPEAREPGYITFTSLNGLATNLSNMPAHISDKKPAVLQSTFKVMDKAQVQITVKLPLLNKAGYHTIEGTIGEARPAILNPILVPVSFIKIEKGYLREGRFKAELTARKGAGSMLVYYNNLEVELLNKGEGSNQGVGKKLLSEVADWVAIKDANPMNGEKARTGKISVTRDPDKPILDYWKNCVVSGFLSTMGLEKLAQK